MHKTLSVKQINTSKIHHCIKTYTGFPDFISQAKSLFQELDLSNRGRESVYYVYISCCMFLFLLQSTLSSFSSGHADYTLCVAMLSQLTTTVSQTKQNHSLR